MSRCCTRAWPVPPSWDGGSCPREWPPVLGSGGQYAGPAALHGAPCRSLGAAAGVADGSGWPRPAV